MSDMPPSRIRPPNPIASPVKALYELNDFDSNVRAKQSLLPVAAAGSKHKLSGPFEQPESKRKTLVERAGEHLSKTVAGHPAPRNAVKATSLQAPGTRNPAPPLSRHASFSSSMRNTSHTRTASHSSFASSVGPGTRHPSTSSYGRPQTAVGGSGTRSIMGKPNYIPNSHRSATSLSHTNEEVAEEEHGTEPSDRVKAWNTDQRLELVEASFSALKSQLDTSINVKESLEDAVNIYKSRITDLEELRTQLTTTNASLQAEIEATKQQLATANTAMDDQQRAHRLATEDLQREHRHELEDVRKMLADQTARLVQDHRNEVHDLERRLKAEHQDEKNALIKEFELVKSQITEGNQHSQAEMQKKEHEIEQLRSEVESAHAELAREKAQAKSLQDNFTEASSTSVALENTVRSLRSQITFLESDSMSQSQRFEDMEASLQAALASAKDSKEKLMKEESIRRSLFNQVQELKGNIRVMCRVRPLSAQEGPDDTAALSFPDSHKESKELELLGPLEKSSLGKETRKTNAFSFDRVFGQASRNEEIFEEISQLVQSALDGYNVCIFCYGQTGSGKTYTMSSADGMIPRAVKQIYETATRLQEKNWSYKMEGSFIEVYNEELHDLLGHAKDFDKKKHEIRHDAHKKQTTVTDLTTVALDSADTVEAILTKAMANRSVASTLSNERSSRSHSVFILKLLGTNAVTGEVSEGTLNLVDLAGSERLKQSGAEGARMKETQNINKSLSCLGDVIGALGNGKEGSHIPYRNSKLTYLLQFSLGGNSKTLMFVMISPLQAHLHETLTSLKFATKVHNTHIGTAKRSLKVRD